MANGLQDVAWDSASSARILFGTIIVPVLKFDVPKEEIKTEKVPRVGEVRPTKRTAGRMEIGDIAVEIELSDYEALILPRMPKHGATLIEFVITCNVKHASVAGSYGMLLDGCRIVSREGPSFAPDEKALVKKLGISVMATWERGRDGVWKCLDLNPKLPSSQAQAAMTF